MLMIKYDKDSETYIIDPENENTYTRGDFESIESVDALDELMLKSNFDYFDSNGLSPLCFAVKNNVDSVLIVYLAGGDFSDSHWDKKGKGATVDKPCKNGKTPLKMAIESGNASAVNILLGGTVKVPYMEEKHYGTTATWVKKPLVKDDVIQLDKNGNFLYEDTDIKIPAQNLAKANAKDIFAAASLPSADMLKAIGENYSGMWALPYSKYNGSKCQVFDLYGSTPLIAATKMQCYDSIRYILENKITSIDSRNSAVLYTSKPMNGNADSAMTIALDLGDEEILDIFEEYSIKKDEIALDYYYSRDQDDKIISMLKGMDRDSLYDKDFLSRKLTRTDYDSFERVSITVEKFIYNNKNEISEVLDKYVPEDGGTSKVSVLIAGPFYDLIKLLYNEGKDPCRLSEYDKQTIRGATNLDNDKLPDGLKHIVP